MKKTHDIIGKKFGRLLVVRFDSKRIYNKKFLCLCECGTKKIIEGNRLTSGHTKSCGCLHSEIIRKIKTKHGFAKGVKVHPLYSVWRNIKNRCFNKNVYAYKNYGQRGITICKEWKESPEMFIEWCIKNGWKKNLQIDRINNNGDYKPSNCRFVSPSDNQYNSRRSLNSLSKKCRDLGVEYPLVLDRLRYGWPLEKALFEPKKKRT